MKQSRRFIAGAVCPQCGAQDKIVIYLDTDERACVACDFREGRPQTDGASEPPTRVSRAAARRVETPSQAVRLEGFNPSDDKR